MQLLPERAVYWEQCKTLIIADTHFGKATHFRKAGIPVSDEVFLDNLKELDLLINRYSVARVLVVGDFFHSDYNSEWSRFSTWLEESNLTEWLLVPGNHDVFTRKHEAGTKFRVTSAEYIEAGILFRHEPGVPADVPVICGHIHPGIRIYGQGRQSLMLPCFVQSAQLLILPAFGKFTGLGPLKSEKGFRYFALTGQSVIETNYAI